MTWVRVAITRDAEGRAFAEMRRGEIGVGHESALLVALSHQPIIAALEEVVGLLQQYWGPSGSVALASRFDAPDNVVAHYHPPGAREGRAHGIAWTVVERPEDDARWLDPDERCQFLAGELLSGALEARPGEGTLATAWAAYDGDKHPRPHAGLREDEVLTELRAFRTQLELALGAAGGEPEPWSHLGEQRRLADGSVLQVERVISDGGHTPGLYCLSRYVIGVSGVLNEDGLCDRIHLFPETPAA